MNFHVKDTSKNVIPANAGIQPFQILMDPRVRGDDIDWWDLDLEEAGE